MAGAAAIWCVCVCVCFGAFVVLVIVVCLLGGAGVLCFVWCFVAQAILCVLCDRRGIRFVSGAGVFAICSCLFCLCFELLLHLHGSASTGFVFPVVCFLQLSSTC